jgi:phosphonate transport system substrate-binding protein
VPEGALTEIWTSPPYNHCMFTARPDLDPSLEQGFAEALSGMSYDNPSHRAVLDAEGLRREVAASKLARAMSSTKLKSRVCSPSS